MQIVAYCPKCNKTSTIDHDIENTQPIVSEKTTKLAIPTPNLRNKSNGLLKLSIAHEDHILLLEVDNNGSVRNTTTVSRIRSETRIAQFMALLTELIIECGKMNQSKYIILSDDPNWDQIVNYLVSQFMLNSIKLQTGENYNEFSLNYYPGSFELIVNNCQLSKYGISDAILSKYNQDTIIIDLNNIENIHRISNFIHDSRNAIHSFRKIGFSISSQPIFSQSNLVVNKMLRVLTQNKVATTISDCSSMEKRVMFLLNLLNEDLSE